MINRSYAGELRLANLNQKVLLAGWVAKKRNLGSIVFIDLRDRSGIVQVTMRDELNDIDIRNEYVIEVIGKVSKKDVPNKQLKTGEIEVIAESVKVLSKAETTPLIIADKTDALEDVRLKYRYLDLRRPVLQHNLILRSKIVKAAHEYFDSNGFIEVETPCLTLSTPEGARDYLVPSRVNLGKFYALPQSPQLFKQLLMIAGFEKYYQIARCFRDEDLRQDRQPEFTQIDVETSFLDQDEILTLAEGFIKKMFKDTINVDVKTPLRRMDYSIALNEYGSDKPDTRFEMKLFDIKNIVKDSEFSAFKNAESVKAIVVAGVNISRKVSDNLVMEAKKYGADSLAVLKIENDSVTGSVSKYLSESQKKQLIKASNAKSGDYIVISWGHHDQVCFALGAIRLHFARELNLIKPNTYDFLWVVNFPLFEKDLETGEYKALHHPFTRPTPETSQYLDSDPSKVLSAAYDIVINGSEAGGGSLRIYDQDMQKKIFRILGLSDEDIKRKFGYFVNAFKYGTPPHGGLAFGLERLSMIVCGSENIRDVIAFPKNLKAICPMSNAPTEVDEQQLKDLGIIIK